jgi:hypothetical protein
MSGLRALLTQHVASSLTKQHALDEFLGEHRWELDLERGTVDFGEGRRFPIQILGTESELSNTWLWAWDNRVNDIPLRLLTAAHQLRALGESEGIAELTERAFPLIVVDGHALALIASGVCNADCYYRGPYEGGAVFFLVTYSPLARRAPTPAHRIASIIAQAISLVDVDHRPMVESYLRQEGFDFREQAGTLRGRAPDGREIVVSFDALGRVSRTDATASPATPSAGAATRRQP